MNFKESIEALRLAKLVDRFPNNNLDWINKFWYEIAVKFTKGRSAAGIEKNIIAYLKLRGFQAEKRSVEGRVIDNTKNVTDVLGFTRVVGSKTRIPSTGTKGSADISAVVYSLAVFIEVKKGKDRQSDHQKKYESAVEKAGAFYMIAKDEDHFLEVFLELIEHPKFKLMKDYTDKNPS